MHFGSSVRGRFFKKWEIRAFMRVCSFYFSALFQKNDRKEFLSLKFCIPEAENPCEE